MKKRSNSLLMIFFAISVLVNLVFIYFFFFNTKEVCDKEITNYSKNSNVESLSDPKNYIEIFVNKNNSLYRNLYGEYFVDDPLNAFFLSCSYYMTTKDTAILHDIKMVSLELSGRYGYAPKVKVE